MQWRLLSNQMVVQMSQPGHVSSLSVARRTPMPVVFRIHPTIALVTYPDSWSVRKFEVSVYTSVTEPVICKLVLACCLRSHCNVTCATERGCAGRGWTLAETVLRTQQHPLLQQRQCVQGGEGGDGVANPRDDITSLWRPWLLTFMGTELEDAGPTALFTDHERRLCQPSS